MIVIQHRNNVPPGGGWVYIQPESGMAFKHPDLMHVKHMVKAHRLANNYPIGANFDAEIETSICGHSPELCIDVTPESELNFTQKLARFSKAMIGFAASGFKTVTQEQYQKRLEICQVCDKWRGNTGILTIACAACGCSGKKLGISNESCPLNPPKWGKEL